jgi:glucose-6-phosphate 1-dehydrogenase
MTPAPLASGVLVIFGITGDLARKKLLPALYHLVGDGLLPDQFEIIGVTRRGIAVADLIATVKDEVCRVDGQCDEPALARLQAMLSITKMDMAATADFHELKSTLDRLEDERGTCLNRLFYLSIPPNTYGPVIDQLGESGLGSGCQHGTADSRIMVEKPFGYDLASAEELIERIKHSFSERQIYRIDHYLAKETAQNILTFRLSNPIFADIWDGQHISQIVITAAESIGIEGRANFYEPTGALRDLIQSHLLQVLTLVTMELPETLSAEQVHARKLQLLHAITPLRPNEVAGRTVRGQYEGYRDEVANPDSVTETFARVTLDIQTERWRGVLVVLQTGKRLDRKNSSITLTFGNDDSANTLTFRLQPDEGIGISLLAKKPGFKTETERVEMTFDYHHAFGSGTHPDAYERVLVDGIHGDQTLFPTSDEVLAAWRVVEAVVHEWAKDDAGLKTYAAGTAPDDL